MKEKQKLAQKYNFYGPGRFFWPLELLKINEVIFAKNESKRPIVPTGTSETIEIQI